MCATASFTIQTAVTGGDAVWSEGADVKATQLNGLTFATSAGAAFVAMGLSLPASAQAATSGIGSAQDTVNELQKNGFKVVLNKMGTGPLDRCTVDSVRPGMTVIRPVRNGVNLVNQIVYQSVYLTAKC
jgi:hypothetical protein